MAGRGGGGAARLTEEERQLRERHGRTLEQIGYRREWRAGFRALAAQEFAEDAESCFRASGECVFDVAAIDQRLGELTPPIEVRWQGALQVWLPPVAGKRYVVAVDTAGGGAEGDYSVAQVVELRSGLQCAELRAKLPPLELAMEVRSLHLEYGKAWVVVERNNHGSGVLAHLSGMVDREHIYCSGHVQQGPQGWLTSAATRPVMLSELGALLVEQPELFRSERLLRECRSFVRLANGRTGAKSGEHDDCVMAMAIAQAVREQLLPKKPQLLGR